MKIRLIQSSGASPEDFSQGVHNITEILYNLYNNLILSLDENSIIEGGIIIRIPSDFDMLFRMKCYYKDLLIKTDTPAYIPFESLDIKNWLTNTFKIGTSSGITLDDAMSTTLIKDPKATVFSWPAVNSNFNELKYFINASLMSKPDIVKTGVYISTNNFPKPLNTDYVKPDNSIKEMTIPISLEIVKGASADHAYSGYTILPLGINKVKFDDFNPKNITTLNLTFLAGSVIEEIVVPSINNITSSGGVLSYCALLRKIIFSEGIISIQDSIFELNYSLLYVEFPSTLTSLGSLGRTNKYSFAYDNICYVVFKSVVPPLNFIGVNTSYSSSSYKQGPRKAKIYVPDEGYNAYLAIFHPEDTEMELRRISEFQSTVPLEIYLMSYLYNSNS